MDAVFIIATTVLLLVGVFGTILLVDCFRAAR
jgi:hypothetical protein